MLLILSAVAQANDGGIDFLWILLPLVLLMLTRQRGESSQESRTTTESWYTIQDIETIYAAIEAKSTEWRDEANERKSTSVSLISKLKDVLGGEKNVERFLEKETNPPRLYQMEDSTGPIYFELTEVESGGTVVKTMYNSEIKSQMAKFKVDLPLKIPATPIGLHCPTCGKPVLSEFSLCPYCGEELIKRALMSE